MCVLRNKKMYPNFLFINFLIIYTCIIFFQIHLFNFRSINLIQFSIILTCNAVAFSPLFYLYVWLFIYLYYSFIYLFIYMHMCVPLNNADSVESLLPLNIPTVKSNEISKSNEEANWMACGPLLSGALRGLDGPLLGTSLGPPSTGAISSRRRIPPASTPPPPQILFSSLLPTPPDCKSVPRRGASRRTRKRDPAWGTYM